MVKKDFDTNLLGRLAGSLEDQGTLLRNIQETSASNSKELSSISTSMQSAHARLGKLEHSINGNGTPGIKTKVALAEQEAEAVKERITNESKDIKERITSLEHRIKEHEEQNTISSTQKIQELKDDKKTGSASRLSIALTAIAIIVSIIALVPTCGPLAIKAFKAPTAKSSK